MAISLDLDFSADYLVWDNLSECRIYPAPRADATSFDVLKVTNRAPSTRELIQGNGAYCGSDRVWIIPRAELGGAPFGYRLQPGDVIREPVDDADGGDVEWTVLSPADWEKLTDTQKVVTRSLALNANLRDSVTILRPRIALGAAAEPDYRWDQATTVAASVPARVQPDMTSVEVHNDVESAATRYNVILGQQVSLQKDDRFRATIKATGETVLLQWTEHRNHDRLDEFPAISCVRVG